MPYNVSMSMESYAPTLGYQQTVVKFMAEFGASYSLSEDLIQDKAVLTSVTDRVRLGVIEAVFGEFRTPIKEIEHLLYTRQYDDALDKVHALEKSMFS